MAVTFHGSHQPSNPQVGDVFIDSTTSGIPWLWTGCGWVPIGGTDSELPFTPPTAEQLEKHPSLKTAWEELLIVKKLLGV